MEFNIYYKLVIYANKIRIFTLGAVENNIVVFESFRRFYQHYVCQVVLFHGVNKFFEANNEYGQ